MLDVAGTQRSTLFFGLSVSRSITYLAVSPTKLVRIIVGRGKASQSLFRKELRMGWGSGGDIADSVWDIVSRHIPKDKQAEVAASLIDMFEGHDCDTMQETALWDLAHDDCLCRDEDGESDSDCKDCDGRGYVRKEIESTVGCDEEE